MPQCKLSDDGPIFTEPPLEIHAISPILYTYLQSFHRRAFGLGPDATGDLDVLNINGDLDDTVDHNLFQNVLPYQHHGSNLHSTLDQAVAVADAIASVVAITAADADATYGQPEADLINELKSQLVILRDDVNALQVKVNALLSALRVARVMAT